MPAERCSIASAIIPKLHSSYIGGAIVPTILMLRGQYRTASNASPNKPESGAVKSSVGHKSVRQSGVAKIRPADVSKTNLKAAGNVTANHASATQDLANKTPDSSSVKTEL